MTGRSNLCLLMAFSFVDIGELDIGNWSLVDSDEGVDFHPEVVSAVDCVTQVCREAGLPLGIFGVSAEAVRPYIERGYTLVVVGVDTMMLGQAAGQLLAQVKA